MRCKNCPAYWEERDYFYGVEDWELNDICSLTMFNNNTPEIYDDIIIGTTYGGNLEMIMNEW